jgi:catechol 2,3-dioxygenase-like lactoylglutathione lyase family enzyme
MSPGAETTLNGISAVTLRTSDMRRAVGFYRALGFALVAGGEDASFTTLAAGRGMLNLERAPRYEGRLWGRVIFHVSDVDACHRRAVAAGFHPDGAPRDAPWGERYFHLRDPDGHELSFARPLTDAS